jgi:hypothetical protein
MASEKVSRAFIHLDGKMINSSASRFGMKERGEVVKPRVKEPLGDDFGVFRYQLDCLAMPVCRLDSYRRLGVGRQYAKATFVLLL